VLQIIRRLLIRPQCFRLGRHAPVGTSTRGSSTPSQGTHNNIAERAIKPFGIGRKNWMFFGSDRGGRTLATLASFTATCELLKINPWLWLRDTLTHLPITPPDQFATLLPTAAK
jgi:Transposase IS66 family/IS66 C-terminal element